MSKKVEYTITQKRKALAVAHQVLTKHRPKYSGKHFCGDISFGIDAAIHVLAAMYEEALEKESKEAPLEYRAQRERLHRPIEREEHHD